MMRIFKNKKGDNLTIATTFVVFLNILMWFCQVAMLNINPSGPTMYSEQGTIIGETISGAGNGSVVNNDIIADLPTSAGTVQTGDTGFFTDIFNNILGWMKSTPGIRHIYGIVSAPYNVLNALGLPREACVGLGALWYLVSLTIVLAFIWGRQ
jgi:hypothetical protein